MSDALSIAQSSVTVFGMDLVVHQLDTGERVIEAESMERFFAALADSETLSRDEALAIIEALSAAPGGGSA